MWVRQLKDFPRICGHKCSHHFLRDETYIVNSSTMGTSKLYGRPAANSSPNIESPVCPSDVTNSFHCPGLHQPQPDCRTLPLSPPPPCIDMQPATFDCTRLCRRRNKACSIQSDPSTASTWNRKKPRLGWDKNNPWFWWACNLFESFYLK